MSAVDISAMIDIFGMEDKALFSSKLNSFIERFDRDIEKIDSAIEANRMEDIVFDAHKLKLALGDLFESIEAAAKENDLENVKKYFDQALGEALSVKQFVESYFSSKLNSFIERFNRSIEKIDSAIEANRMEDIVFDAHKLKSASRMVGALALGDLFESIEAAAKENDLENVKKYFDQALGEALER
jgi:HPt (histidine-containing phosphotransfer) domain-containing protein